MIPTAAALNHLLVQNSAAKQLRPHADKVVRLAVPPLDSTLIIGADGLFTQATPDRPVDAEIHLGPATALRTLLDRDAIPEVRLAGDIALATAVGKVLQALRWDAEADLSRVIGDIPAHLLGRASGALRQACGAQAASVAGMLAEYWLEERPLIARRSDLEHFSRNVDTLRDDAERLSKRLDRLQQAPPGATP